MIAHRAPTSAADLALAAAERTLRERARRLATEAHDDAPTRVTAGTEVLLCRLHDERYAIELSRLRAVQSARGLAPLPGTPGFVAGMLNVRGMVVTVLDLARCLDLPPGPPADDALVLLTDAGGKQRGLVGVLVHEVVGSSRIAFADLDRAFSGNSAVRGIATGETIILDLAALLADGRFEVAEEW